MNITIYKEPNKYMTHSFTVTELDKIKEICYSMDIKWYVITKTEQEIMKYEQLSKGHN